MATDKLPPLIPKQLYEAATTIIPISQVRRLWYQEVKYLAQGHTVKESSLESSPGRLKPKPVQMAMPHAIRARDGQAGS